MKYTENSIMTAINNNVPYEYSDYVLKKYFLETGEKQGWLKSNENIITAVSGGGDSIALLWLCRKFYSGNITAVHINHGIRGVESDGDEEFTRDFCKKISVEFVPVKISVPDEKLKGESLESAARRIRLQYICMKAHELNIKTVFLGHNRDDLAETVLFNILRGTGIRGSVGITESSELEGIKFYRPLLGLRRNFLREILKVRGLSWREDSTNENEEYTRNFIRLNLLPLIEKNINSAAIEHIANFGEDMRKIRENEDEISIKLLNECRKNESDSMILDRKKLRKLGYDYITLIVREIGRELNLRTLSRNRCIELAELINKQKNFRFQWCGGVEVIAMNGKIIFQDGREKNI